MKVRFLTILEVDCDEMDSYSDIFNGIQEDLESMGNATIERACVDDLDVFCAAEDVDSLSHNLVCPLEVED